MIIKSVSHTGCWWWSHMSFRTSCWVCLQARHPRTPCRPNVPHMYLFPPLTNKASLCMCWCLAVIHRRGSMSLCPTSWTFHHIGGGYSDTFIPVTRCLHSRQWTSSGFGPSTQWRAQIESLFYACLINSHHLLFLHIAAQVDQGGWAHPCVPQQPLSTSLTSGPPHWLTDSRHRP